MTIPKNLVVIDFETLPIGGDSDKTGSCPEPVGVAIKPSIGQSYYMSWGHPYGNTNTKEEAITTLSHLFRNFPILCHNAAFDINVAKYHLGIDYPAEIHDTMLLLFLRDPHAHTLALKPAAELLLHRPPEERNAVDEWCMREFGVSKKKAGAYIGYCVVSLVAPYAISDVDTTFALFELLYDAYSGVAYSRECRLLPILCRNTLQGIRLDLLKLLQDFVKYTKIKAEVEAQIYQHLGKQFNIGSGMQLVKAIEEIGIEADWVLTDKGNISTSKNNLLHAVKDPLLLGLLRYRATLSTYLNSFMEPWISKENKGVLHFSWNQVRNAERGGYMGTRSGRLSSVPSMLNVPVNLNQTIIDGYIALGHVWVERDYCFSPDTQFLTDSGFKYFDEIDIIVDKLASWAYGRITYEHPIRAIEQQYVGDMIHTYGSASFDIMATPEHNMMLLPRSKTVRVRGGQYKVPLQYANIGDNPNRTGTYGYLPQAGTYHNSIVISGSEMIILAAYQADGSLKTESTGRVMWKLSKERKIDRLQKALTKLSIPFKVSYQEYDYEPIPFTRITAYLPNWVFEYCTGFEKTFTRKVLTLPKEFLNEITLWDGSRNTAYISTNEVNINLMQELATIRNRNSTITLKEQTGYGFKPCYYLSIHEGFGSFTKTQAFDKVPYNGRIVCFEMPHGTLVLRRNGKPFVAHNCSQELRILAHYEDGAMMRAFQNNPKLDLHQMMSEMLSSALGHNITRRKAKDIAFSILYGKGFVGLAATLECTVEEASSVKMAYLAELPGITRVQNSIKKAWYNGDPITTWGGRKYYQEPSTWGLDKATGEYRQFNYTYKGINYLIQGSSADVTKQAIINFDDAKIDGRFLLSVHDSINISTPPEQRYILNEAMQDIKVDVPMLSDGKMGSSYGDLEIDDGC
jgi:DNA polymerase I-like protein with 3'-5' exonuclease and polymerase domains